MSSVLIKKVRLSYLFAFTPRKRDDGSESYQASCIIPKNHPQIPEIKAAIKTEMEAKWPDPKKRPSGLHYPLRDGDADRPDDPAYANSYFINANNRGDPPPYLIDSQLKPAVKGHWESGDYANVKVDFYPFVKESNKGIGVGLVTIQFLYKGEPLGSRTDPMEGFGVEEVPAMDMEKPKNASVQQAGADPWN